MSQYRSSQIYIRSETRRLLRIVARARGLDESVDQVGDELLYKAIIQAAPGLEDLLKEIEAVEGKMTDLVLNKK